MSTSWSNAETARLRAMGAALGPVVTAKVPKLSAYAVSFILALVSATPTPVTRPTTGHDATFTDFWTPSESAVIDRVKHKYALDDAHAVVYATKIVSYLLALGGH